MLGAAVPAHGVSVTIGHFLGLTLPQRTIAFVAARVSVVHRPDNAGGPHRPPRRAAVLAPRFVLLAVISSYVLAELGDETMLATVALAGDHNWTGVWIKATTGIVPADGLAIAVGAALHRRLPGRLLRGLASVLILILGLRLLFDGAPGWRWVAVAWPGPTGGRLWPTLAPTWFASDTPGPAQWPR